jgi:hypothetical protein
MPIKSKKAIRALSHTGNVIMSTCNTKEPLYHMWHSNVENNPPGMMMDNRIEEEGAHITSVVVALAQFQL